jgi:hypothetical protein
MKILIFSILITFSLSASAKPKYGPNATVLSKSHEYINSEKAPDYWALSPYYLPQQNAKSCSVASVAMVVNAARANMELTSDDQLATHDDLLKKVGDKKWSNAVDMSQLGGGVALDELKTDVEESLNAYGLKNYTVTVHHMDKSQAAKDQLHKDLLENEKSANDFIIINFIQGAYTGDADVGHISPIGAYDKKKKRALVMDVDREWYEPYWVSESVLAGGMATTDKTSGHTRGYLYIKLDNSNKLVSGNGE